MPNVLTQQGFKFYFYTDEGSEPAHVHIKKEKVGANGG
jgi:hypothetical protein